MCSILGYFNTNLKLEEIERLNLSMSHRGPDNSSIKEYYFHNKKLYLAHNRLSIQDLNIRANQPMETDRFAIVFNGEIYNHLELRKELEHNWLTNSDTETLLALFEKFGIERTLSKLIGMFAIGLFDKKNQKLYLIRDRVGIKPLYWSFKNGEFIFSSQIKGFREELKEKSNKSLVEFMSFGYTPYNRSFFKDINKLPPAHILIFDGKSVKLNRYWDLPKEKIKISYQEALEETKRLVESAVKYRLLSDLEVGAFLSGGVDSSLISSKMAETSDGRIKTFTIGFEDKKYNEADFAKKIAEHIGSRHYEYIFKIEDVLDLMEDMDEFYDEPFGDSSALPTMLLSKFTKEHVTVALSGDGGDELFLGYDRYFFTDKYFKLFTQIPKSLRDMLYIVAKNSNVDKLEKIAYPLKNLTKENLYSVMATYTKPWQLQNIFSKEFIESIYQTPNPSYLILQNIKTQNEDDIFDNFSKIDFYRYLPDDILTKVDRASMRYSLEARVPLLDHRVVEFAYSLPTDIKLQNGSKSILRDILYESVPRELIDRPKMGFRVPLNRWFREDLREPLLDKIESLDNRFNKEYLRDLYKKHQEGKNYEFIFWNLMRL